METTETTVTTTDALTQIDDLIYHCVEMLVDTPSAIKIEQKPGRGEWAGGTVFIVKVSDGEQGQIIGKHGDLANSVRRIAKAAGKRLGVRVYVEVVNREVK